MYHECPYYALFDVKGRNGSTDPGNLLFCYKGTDRDGEGWDLLNSNLQVAESSAPETPLILRFYDELGKGERLNNTTPYAGSFKCRMQTYNGSVATTARGGSGGDLLNQLFAAKLENLEAKWERKLEDQEREHQEELAEMEEDKATRGKSKELGFIGMIGAAGEQYPHMQEPINQLLSVFTSFLKDAATIFTHKIMKSSPTQSATIGKVPNDAPPDQQMNKALQDLIYYNVRRFGWPSGYTAEQMAAASDAEKEQAHQQGFIIFTDTLVKLSRLTEDDDIYDLAVKKLNAL